MSQKSRQIFLFIATIAIVVLREVKFNTLFDTTFAQKTQQCCFVWALVWISLHGNSQNLVEHVSDHVQKHIHMILKNQWSATLLRTHMDTKSTTYFNEIVRMSNFCRWVHTTNRWNLPAILCLPPTNTPTTPRNANACQNWPKNTHLSTTKTKQRQKLAHTWTRNAIQNPKSPRECTVDLRIQSVQHDCSCLKFRRVMPKLFKCNCVDHAKAIPTGMCKTRWYNDWTARIHCHNGKRMWKSTRWDEDVPQNCGKIKHKTKLSNLMPNWLQNHGEWRDCDETSKQWWNFSEQYKQRNGWINLKTFGQGVEGKKSSQWRRQDENDCPNKWTTARSCWTLQKKHQEWQLLHPL